MTTLARRTADTPIQQARSWADLPASDIKRRAATAANERDPDELLSLLNAYAALYGSSGEATLRKYRSAVRQLLNAWQGVNLLRPGRDAGSLYIRELELAPSTISVHLSACKMFYRALRWTNATTAHPFEDVRAPRDKTEAWDKREAYTQDELEQLLNHADPAMQVVVLLGAHAGLRVSEMCKLRWDDIGRRQLTVIRGKGSKTGKVTMSNRLKAALEELRADPPKRRKGKALTYVLPWQPRQTRQRLEQLCAAAGVMYKSVHSLRHSAGTRFYAETKDPFATADHLRQSDVKTTRGYAKRAERQAEGVVSDW